jgi:malate dehydrogenase (oxaloacetate-decarboxylating)
MVKAAAQELVRHLPTQRDKEGSLLPALSQARDLGHSIAQAVGKQAIEDGQAQVGDEDALNRELQANIWEPVYVPYERPAQVFRQSV